MPPPEPSAFSYYVTRAPAKMQPLAQTCIPRVFILGVKMGEQMTVLSDHEAPEPK